MLVLKGYSSIIETHYAIDRDNNKYVPKGAFGAYTM